MNKIDTLSIEKLNLKIGSRILLQDVDLTELKRGEVLAVIGTNGAGKSSLMRCLCGLLKFKGQLRFNETVVPPLAQARRDWSPSIGYVPQDVRIQAKISVMELLLLAQKSHQRSLNVKVDELENSIRVLNKLQISELAEKPCPNLSGGEMQMVSLAQAMVLSPSLLLLDEPTSALDLRHQISSLNMVRDYTRKKDELGHPEAMAIIILHDLNLALKFADKVLLIDKGRVAAFGPISETLDIELIKKHFEVEGEFLINGRGESILSVY